MLVYNFIFYLFAGMIVFSAFMVVIMRNPVHCVLFLILTFFNGAGLFLLRGAEFLAMTLVIVYVGAVAVLFLFVVMMLDIQIENVKRKLGKYFVVGAGLGMVLFVELMLAIVGSSQNPRVGSDLVIGDNTRELGILLYRDYAYMFEAVGMVLLVAMLGAIILTLRVRLDVKKQNISRQIARDSKTTVQLQDPLQRSINPVDLKIVKPKITRK